MVKIFDIQGGNIVVNENCLLIPELKLIMDTYENPLPVFGYIHFMSDPKSPYANLDEAFKEESILADYEGDYTPDDEPVYKALEKMKRLYETPSMRLLRQATVGLKTLGDYLEKAQIRDDKDGNSVNFRESLKSIRKINQEYKALAKDVEDELRVRGEGLTGYDELSDD